MRCDTLDLVLYGKQNRGFPRQLGAEGGHALSPLKILPPTASQVRIQSVALRHRDRSRWGGERSTSTPVYIVSACNSHCLARCRRGSLIRIDRFDGMCGTLMRFLRIESCQVSPSTRVIGQAILHECPSLVACLVIEATVGHERPRRAKEMATSQQHPRHPRVAELQHGTGDTTSPKSRQTADLR